MAWGGKTMAMLEGKAMRPRKPAKPTNTDENLETDIDSIQHYYQHCVLANCWILNGLLLNVDGLAHQTMVGWLSGDCVAKNVESLL
jgi:hypothetical protein